MTLRELSQGESGYITKVKGRGAFRKRIMEMGFVVGKKVTVIRKAPLRDPIEYNIMGYNVSLRRHEAQLIEVVTNKELENLSIKEFNGVIDEYTLKTSNIPKRKEINIALIGNPNSGKTTLFNYASGSHERVGNYTGVTVDAKKAHFNHNGYLFNIIDLPGTYSITCYTPEELYVREYILDKVPDVVVNIIDASNLERNLYLTTQLIDMDIKVVIALNMYDELLRKGDKLDYHSLGKMIGIPIVPTISSKRKGIKELFDKIIDVYEDRDETVRHIHINYGKTIEDSIKRLQEVIKVDGNYRLTNVVAPRFLAIKLIERDKDTSEQCERCINKSDIFQTANDEIKRIEKVYNDNSESIITDAKYGFISGALKETVKPGTSERRRRSDIIDIFFTHKIWGFPIFIIFLWIMFGATFRLGAYPMHWIESGVNALSTYLSIQMPEGILKDLLINGIISGIGGVIVFLPNILILFFFISLMEDTGYMARAVFIMDKVMHKIGLHGKSFIPLIMGFGCNVPAIMATRTLENRNDRMITMLINPFISCSARLPVYLLLIGAFFPDHAGSVLFLIYVIGIIIAVLTAILLKKTIFRSSQIPFVMELPPYRIPTFRSTIIHMWGKGVEYLKKIGGIILVATILIWALGYFPVNIDYSRNYKQEKEQIKAKYNNLLSETTHLNPSAIDSISLTKEHDIQTINLKQKAEQQEKSYIGRLGHLIEPIMQPLGFDWKMSISILSGVAAKEIVVSTMGVLYMDEDISKTTQSNSLTQKLKAQTYNSGQKKGMKVFTPLVAFSFMAFVLLFFPCIGTIVTISKESGSWKWGAFSIIYTTAVAWIISFSIFQIGSLLS